ncbi:unnamed protein product [Macrosiphum euphorbiae]|nr:unnamed protein product [Macrosiphum euphorbiae]
MPETYNNVVTAIETLSIEKLTIEFVKGRLLDEEAKKTNTTDIPQQRSTAFGTTSNSSFPFKCYGCDKVGHRVSECKFKKKFGRDKNKKSWKKSTANNVVSKSEDAVCFSIGKDMEPTEKASEIFWFIDSGCSDHLVNQEKYFSFIKQMETPLNIGVAKNGESLIATKTGTIISYSRVDGEEILCKFENVYYVPNLRYNLLSVGKIEQLNFKVVFENGLATITKPSGNVVAVARRMRTLYGITFSLKPNTCANNCIDTQIDESLWHKRMGHPNKSYLWMLRDMVTGLNLNKNDIPDFCQTCVESKHSRKPFQSRSFQTRRPLEIVHSDVCGPISPTTWNGKKYFLSFTDDYTRFSIIYLLEKKSQVFQCFQNYEATVSAFFDLKVSILRCDNGGEYVSNELKRFCSVKGIVVDYTVPYTPEQNGLAERLNRTLVERTRSLLLQSNLSKEMWGEAVLTAAYLGNRLPTHANIKKTPVELWTGSKPNLNNIRIFGCVAFAHIPDQLRRKLDSKSKRCIFVGYTKNGYRLWDPLTKTVFVSRDVIFNEKELLNPIITNNEKEILVEINNSEIAEESKETTEQESQDEERKTENEVDKVIGNNIPTQEQLKRNRKTPTWHKDYEMSMMALSAEY